MDLWSTLSGLADAQLFSASFRLCPFPVLNKLIMPLTVMPLSFVPLSGMKQNQLCLFPLCFFPFLPLSDYALFRIYENWRLCRIPLCQLPRPRLARIDFFHKPKISFRISALIWQIYFFVAFKDYDDIAKINDPRTL
jgi:hypothetical protein